jgi:4-amino-4-deoxy-L-arabinose transferase-like glycosyltransferase
MKLSPSRKLLIAGGLALIIFAMTYGLWYAIFAEHQHLEGMGAALATGFAKAASGNLTEAHKSIDQYAGIKYHYVRHVDVHSHWGGLAMILIVLGAMFDRVGFSERLRLYLAWTLLIGSLIFPFGVILQTVSRSAFPSALAVAGSALVIIGLVFVAIGFSRKPGVS